MKVAVLFCVTLVAAQPPGPREANFRPARHELESELKNNGYDPAGFKPAKEFFLPPRQEVLPPATSYGIPTDSYNIPLFNYVSPHIEYGVPNNIPTEEIQGVKIDVIVPEVIATTSTPTTTTSPTTTAATETAAPTTTTSAPITTTTSAVSPTTAVPSTTTSPVTSVIEIKEEIKLKPIEVVTAKPVINTEGAYFVVLPSPQLQRVQYQSQNDYRNIYTAKLQYRNENAPIYVYSAVPQPQLEYGKPNSAYIQFV